MADIKTASRKGTFPANAPDTSKLHIAIQKGDVNEVKSRLSKAAKTDMQKLDSMQQTPLIAAVYGGVASVVEDILKF